MKKILALALATLMLVSLVACSKDKNKGGTNLEDYEQEEVVITQITTESGSTFHFEAVDSETVILTKYVGKDELHDVVVPDTLNGKKLVAIGNEAFYYLSNVRSVTLPAGVTSIGDYAFAGCAKLESFTLPATVTTIGKYTFANCTALTSFTFATGSTLTAIPYAAFYGCTALTAVEIPASAKLVDSLAFFNCSALATVTVSEGVEMIGSQAFHNCVALTEVNLAQSVQSVGSMAFANCPLLNSEDPRI